MTTKSRHQRITADDLRDGDLMHCGISTNYVLISHTEFDDDGRVAVFLYDGTTPDEAPSFRLAPDAVVALSRRGMRP